MRRVAEGGVQSRGVEWQPCREALSFWRFAVLREERRRGRYGAERGGRGWFGPLVRESGQTRVSASGDCFGHRLLDRVADETLEVVFGRCCQSVVAECGRGFAGEHARSTSRVSVSFDQHVGADRWFSPCPRRDERAVGREHLEPLLVVRGDVGERRVDASRLRAVARDEPDADRGDLEDAPEPGESLELHERADEEGAEGAASEEMANEKWAAFVVCLEVHGRLEALELAGHELEDVVRRVVGVRHEVLGERLHLGADRGLCWQLRKCTAFGVVPLVVQDESFPVDCRAEVRCDDGLGRGVAVGNEAAVSVLGDGFVELFEHVSVVGVLDAADRLDVDRVRHQFLHGVSDSLEKESCAWVLVHQSFPVGRECCAWWRGVEGECGSWLAFELPPL